MTEEARKLADELLPCPFCGAKPTIKGGYLVHCSNDDCVGPQTTAASLVDNTFQWNTRYPHPGTLAREEVAQAMVENLIASTDANGKPIISGINTATDAILALIPLPAKTLAGRTTTSVLPRSEGQAAECDGGLHSTPSHEAGTQRLLEATAAQHFDLPKGQPAQFVRNGVLETCQCRECAVKAGTQEPVAWRWRKDTGEILSEWINNDSLDCRTAQPREFLLDGKFVCDGFHIEKAYAAPASHGATALERVQRCAMSTQNLFDLAQAVHDAREAYLDAITRGPGGEVEKRRLQNALWDDKGSFAPALRELAETRAALTPTLRGEMIQSSTEQAETPIGHQAVENEK